MSAAYRIRQFIAALTAHVDPRELQILDQYLDVAQKELFLAMRFQDQRHSLNVFYQLAQSGHGDRELLQAALLHDLGKANAGLSTGHRVAIVLLKAFWPGLLKTISSPTPGSWRNPFWIHRHHGDLGAEMVARCGGNAKLVSLVRQHQHPTDDPLATALYDVDGEN